MQIRFRPIPPTPLTGSAVPFSVPRFPLCAATRSARLGSARLCWWFLVRQQPRQLWIQGFISSGACPRPDPLTSVQTSGRTGSDDPDLVSCWKFVSASAHRWCLRFLVSEGTPEKDGAVRGAEAEVTSERERDSNALALTHRRSFANIYRNQS